MKKKKIQKDAHVQKKLPITAFVFTFGMYFQNTYAVEIITGAGKAGIHHIHRKRQKMM